MKAAIFFKSEMAPDAIDGNCYQRGVKILKLLAQLIIKGQLIAADRTPVGGIEHQYDIAALELGQGNLLVWCCRQSKIGGFGAYGKCRHVNDPLFSLVGNPGATIDGYCFSTTIFPAEM